ncbi:KH domain-containing RNA-binding protein qki.S [Trichinella spiralis]|uniref:KH domain-containing RNA-binding protein qki.S n=1 Tax=Trichinella spiralis TaxID=6334 RepID=A0ABR3KAM9_TRISP
MSSLSQLSSTVKQVDEDSTEQFITQLIINVEEHILLHHVNKLLALPMIQNIIQIPTPEPSGQIKKGFAETCYSTAGLPYNMTGRIIGPRGCTVKAIQLLCGCSIELNFIKYNLLLIQIFVEPDYESIVKFKIWKAFQLIYCLLCMDPSGKDVVQAIQSDDFKFYESQVEIIIKFFIIQQHYHSDINDVSAVSSNHYSVGKRFSVEMLKVLEKQMLTSHMSNLLALPMFRDIFSIPSPAASGRIIGPRGLTVKVIQTVCECRIRLRWKEVNALQIEVFVERDFESIVKFKLWRAFECINCLLKSFSSDEDMVNAVQLKDLKFYATRAEMLKVHFPVNLCGADLLNAPLNEKNSFITNLLTLTRLQTFFIFRHLYKLEKLKTHLLRRFIHLCTTHLMLQKE